MTDRDLGRRIKSARAVLGLTQEGLAQILQVSVPKLQRIEAGRRPLRFVEVKDWADELGLPLSFFTDEYPTAIRPAAATDPATGIIPSRDSLDYLGWRTPAETRRAA